MEAMINIEDCEFMLISAWQLTLGNRRYTTKAAAKSIRPFSGKRGTPKPT
jgi:hypothetical protein